MKKDIFLKLKKKFVLSCVLIGGIILLAVMVGIFAFVYTDNAKQVTNSLNLTLRSDRLPNPNCSKIVEIDGRLYFQGAQYDQDDIEDIAEKAFEVKNGKFVENDRSFTVKSETLVDRTVYAIYDTTIIYRNLWTLGLILSVSMIVALCLIALMGLFMSQKAIQPVKESYDRQKQLIANASHELKTPLTIISANLSAGTSNPDSTIADNKKWFDNIDCYIKRMDSLILDMLQLSKMEEQPIPNTKVNLSSVVKTNLLQMEPLCYEKGVTLTSNEIDSNVTIKGDQNSVNRLCLILLDNALKYTEQSGNITVSLLVQGKKAKLSVTNSCKGISLVDLPHIFDRFYRSDKARTSSEQNNRSFGLGLSIAKAIVDSCGGEITAESDSLTYAKFVCVFPME